MAATDPATAGRPVKDASPQRLAYELDVRAGPRSEPVASNASVTYPKAERYYIRRWS